MGGVFKGLGNIQKDLGKWQADNNINSTLAQGYIRKQRMDDLKNLFTQNPVAQDPIPVDAPADSRYDLRQPLFTAKPNKRNLQIMQFLNR